jgi:hypothetical protein
MKKAALLLCAVALVIPVMFAAASRLRNSLNSSRRPAREARALSVGYDLIRTTNSTMLIGAGPEFRADLEGILGWTTWRDIDRSAPGDRWAVVCLILTNDHGQALHIQLQDEYPSGQLRLLSYLRITEPSSAANRSQPVGSETNRAPSAAGSGG